VKLIYVGFSSHKKSIMSWVISKVTGDPFSHSYIKIPIDEMNSSTVFQAAFCNVHFLNYDSFLETNEVYKEFPVILSDDQYLNAKKFMFKESGKKYAVMELIGFIWILLIRKLFKKNIKNPFFNGQNSYICVELVLYFLNIYNFNNYTPGDLYRSLENHEQENLPVRVRNSKKDLTIDDVSLDSIKLFLTKRGWKLTHKENKKIIANHIKNKEMKSIMFRDSDLFNFKKETLDSICNSINMNIDELINEILL